VKEEWTSYREKTTKAPVREGLIASGKRQERTTGSIMKGRQRGRKENFRDTHDRVLKGKGNAERLSWKISTYEGRGGTGRACKSGFSGRGKQMEKKTKKPHLKLKGKPEKLSKNLWRNSCRDFSINQPRGNGSISPRIWKDPNSNKTEIQSTEKKGGVGYYVIAILLQGMMEKDHCRTEREIR